MNMDGVKLLTKNDMRRIYQLPFKIYKINFCGKRLYIKDVFKEDPITLVDGYELDEDVSEYVDKICVSDSYTHIERLVFPAFWIKNKKTDERKVIHRCNTIDGKYTMMIHGGDVNSVYLDNVYIRHLRIINKQE